MSESRSTWPQVTLGEVCGFKYGKSLPESARSGGDVPVFGSNGEVGRHDEALTEGPTIVIGRKGSFGEVNFSSRPCWPIDTTYYVDSTTTKADIRWLTYRLASLGLNKLNKSAAVPGLNRDDAYRQRLLLPPLPEQQRMAAILDKADELRVKRRAATTKLGTLSQSIFVDLFGDPRKRGSLGRTPTSPKLLGALTRIRTGKLDANAADVDGAYPFFTCAVEPLRINTPAFDCNAVLVAGNGDLNVKYYEGKFNAYQRTYVVESVDEVALMPQFLYAFLELYVSELRKQAIGGVIKYIKLPYLTDAVVQLPSEEWQLEFVQRLHTLERLKAAVRGSVAELDALFSSLQDRAFRGHL